MLTYFNIEIPRIYEHCPENQTKTTCQLRSYLANNQDAFLVLPRVNKMLPNTQDWMVARDAVDKMHAICTQCHAQNDQKTR